LEQTSPCHPTAGEDDEENLGTGFFQNWGSDLPNSR
jgi:hypothetical protein